MHWVGDLIFEATVEPAVGCSELALDLTECGVVHRCVIDLSTGKATLSLLDGETKHDFDSGANPVAETTVRAGGRHEIRYSNCDDELLLWVDGDLVQFDQPTTFDFAKIRPQSQRYPRYTPENPLDAAPVAIGVRGGKATIDHLRIDRDKYYIAIKESDDPMNDYDRSLMSGNEARELYSHAEKQRLFGRPDAWERYKGLWAARRTVSFDMDEDQFFPMGDNSPASLDARCWVRSKVTGESIPDRFRDDAYKFADAAYVPRDLMVGKALLVFWPHPWSKPVPMTPNFKRFKLIR